MTQAIAPRRNTQPSSPATRGLTSMTALVRRRPTTSFFVLSCLLSWWAAVPYLLGASPIPTASFGPFLAAVVVLGVTEGRGGVGRLLASMVRWRVPVRAYAMAIGLPALVSGLAIGATLASGGTPAAGALGLWTDLPVTFLVVLLIPGFAGAWEEPGFRGYALGRLERRLGPAGGPLTLGVLWVVWHLPLFLAGQIEPTDVAVIIAASVVIAAVFHTAKDSVLVAMVMHASNNTFGGSYASQVFHGSDLVRLGLFTAVGWWVLAVVVLTRRTRSRQDRPAPPARRLPA